MMHRQMASSNDAVTSVVDKLNASRVWIPSPAIGSRDNDGTLVLSRRFANVDIATLVRGTAFWVAGTTNVNGITESQAFPVRI